jgi:outer membrane receptor protein involved in Fe transport
VFVIDDQDPGTTSVHPRRLDGPLQAASIAYAVDGVLLPDTELFTARLFDLRRFEVLRGPQGALFARARRAERSTSKPGRPETMTGGSSPVSATAPETRASWKRR